MVDRFTKTIFIKKAKEMHGNKYSYNKVKYVNSTTKVVIRCKKHDYEFEITPNNHLCGRGCKLCGYERTAASKVIWSLDKCKRLLEENTYENVSSLRRGNPNLYRGILRSCPELLDVYFPDRVKVYSKTEIMEILERKDISTRWDFKQLNPSAYRAAYDRFRYLLDKYLPSTKYLYTIGEVKQLASKFKYRSEFKQAYPSAYAWCCRNKSLDVVCKHMQPKTHLFNRVIYKYVFPKKRVYIGLTSSPTRRDYQHRSRRGRHYGLLRRYPKVKMEVIEKNLTPEEAVKKEEFYISYYKKLGWNLLNCPGRKRSLGYVKRNNKVVIIPLPEG